jgi:hypothetical protein
MLLADRSSKIGVKTLRSRAQSGAVNPMFGFCSAAHRWIVSFGACFRLANPSQPIYVFNSMKRQLKDLSILTGVLGLVLRFQKSWPHPDMNGVAHLLTPESLRIIMSNPRAVPCPRPALKRAPPCVTPPRSAILERSHFDRGADLDPEDQKAKEIY